MGRSGGIFPSGPARTVRIRHQHDDSNSEGKVHGVGDAYAQTRYVLEKIETALKQAGAEIKDVVRTRMFVTDISLTPEISRAHYEFFHDVTPAATMVQVSGLVSKEMLIKIEVDAVISGE